MYLEKLVAENVKRIRKERGLTQEQLAELCETATSYIGLLETGKNVPKLSTIERIATALNVNPLVFFRDTRQNMLEQQEEIREKKRKFLAKIEKELDYLFLKP